MPTSQPRQDLLHVLARDHRRFDERCRAFLQAPIQRGERLLRGLVTDLLAHEVAEQLLLHPLVAERLPRGHELATLRIEEEDHLERLLVTALARPLASDEFRRAFLSAHLQLVEHTDREELEVFPFLRHVADRDELRRLGRLHSSLLVQIPTRLRCAAPAAELGQKARRPLLCLRDAACEILEELGHPLPGRVAAGDDDLYAPLTDPDADTVDVSDRALAAERSLR